MQQYSGSVAPFLASVCAGACRVWAGIAATLSSCLVSHIGARRRSNRKGPTAAAKKDLINHIASQVIAGWHSEDRHKEGQEEEAREKGRSSSKKRETFWSFHWGQPYQSAFFLITCCSTHTLMFITAQGNPYDLLSCSHWIVHCNALIIQTEV